MVLGVATYKGGHETAREKIHKIAAHESAHC